MVRVKLLRSRSLFLGSAILVYVGPQETGLRGSKFAFCRRSLRAHMKQKALLRFWKKNGR